LTGVATQNSITFTWAAPTTDGGSALTGYTVTLNDGSSCTSATLTCTISNLTAGTSYTASLIAANSVGNSAVATATVLTNAPPAPAPVVRAPSAPRGLSAVASQTTITLTWSAPENNGGASVTGYVVTSDGGLGCTTIENACVITGAVAGKTYVFTVTASNSAGAGLASAAATVTIEAPVVIPPKPVIVPVDAPAAVVKVSPTTGTPVLAGVALTAPVLFNPNSAKLDANDIKQLAVVAERLKGRSGFLLITGFVKHSGRTLKYERTLAAARAKAVARQLVLLGAVVKIGYFGYGAQNRVSPKPTDRKVEVRWVTIP
jgi:outer membrane protein OmpA-like peptidoglycan-associated protein